MNKIITNNDIIKINDLKKEGLSYLQIAKEIGCGKATVFKYLNEDCKFRKWNKETEAEKSRRKSLHVINWKKKRKKELIEYKGGKCELCGYNKCIEALDFHHKDPSLKEFNVSSHSYSFIRMKEEANKCIILCANCHREEHFRLKNIRVKGQGYQDAL